MKELQNSPPVSRIHGDDNLIATTHVKKIDFSCETRGVALVWIHVLYRLPDQYQLQHSAQHEKCPCGGRHRRKCCLYPLL